MRLTPFALVLLFLVSGCQDQAPNQGDASISEMAGRLDAALEMDRGTAREDALLKCAKAAAEAGEGDVVLEAIEAIRNKTSRDELCVICSALLAKQGETAMATAVARQIRNDTLRNEVMNDIATGGQP